MTQPNAILTVEQTFPAEYEELDTIVSGPDGVDYVVDVVDGIKQWVPYLPQPDHIILIEKSQLPFNIATVSHPSATCKPLTDYQKFRTEMTARIKVEHPELNGHQRANLISTLWKNKKEKTR